MHLKNAEITPTIPTSVPSADAFAFWREISERSGWIESPNIRRRGLSGVKKVRLGSVEYYVKQQVNHRHFSAKHPLGRPTALREAEAIEALHRLGIRAPQIAYCGTRKAVEGRQTLLVTQGLSGFTDLDDFLSQHGRRGDAVLLATLIEKLAHTFGVMHRAKWQHSSLYPKHIFVAESSANEQGGGIEVALIDLEKSRRRISASRASSHDINQFRRHFTEFEESDWQLFFMHYKRYFGRQTNLDGPGC